VTKKETSDDEGDRQRRQAGTEEDGIERDGKRRDSGNWRLIVTLLNSLKKYNVM
jgi:hypothetical protein